MERESWVSLEKRGERVSEARGIEWGERGREKSHLPAAMLGALAHMRVSRGESD